MKENRIVKCIWFVFFCLFPIFSLQAEVQNGINGEKVDVVYLTNGVVVRGHIVSAGDGEMVVRTLDGQTKRFALTEVESTSSEIMQTKPEIKKNFYDPGFRGFVELGYGFDVNNTSDVFEINAIGGYRFSKRFFLGLGVGWSNVINGYVSYNRQGGKEIMGSVPYIPFWVDSHFYLGKIGSKTKHLFYTGVRVGYSVNADSPEYQIILFSLSANYQYRLKGHQSFNLSFAYNSGQGEIFFRGNMWGRGSAQTISLRVGYGF